jgi:hypothetical protein
MLNGYEQGRSDAASGLGRIEKVGRRLGDAALDPSAWPELMEEICRANHT